MSYEVLFDFIDKKMRMSHIYQPVMLMALQEEEFDIPYRGRVIINPWPSPATSLRQVSGQIGNRGPRTDGKMPVQAINGRCLQCG